MTIHQAQIEFLDQVVYGFALRDEERFVMTDVEAQSSLRVDEDDETISADPGARATAALSGDRRGSERSAPATLREAALALMNV